MQTRSQPIFGRQFKIIASFWEARKPLCRLVAKVLEKVERLLSLVPQPLTSDLDETFPVSYEESLNTVLQVKLVFYIFWHFLRSWKFRVTIPWSVWCGAPWQTLQGPSRAPSSCLLRLRTLLRPSEKPLFLYPGFFRWISKKNSYFVAFFSAGLPQWSHPYILHQESRSKSGVLQQMDWGKYWALFLKKKFWCYIKLYLNRLNSVLKQEPLNNIHIRYRYRYLWSNGSVPYSLCWASLEIIRLFLCLSSPFCFAGRPSHLFLAVWLLQPPLLHRRHQAELRQGEQLQHRRGERGVEHWTAAFGKTQIQVDFEFSVLAPDQEVFHRPARYLHKSINMIFPAIHPNIQIHQHEYVFT